MRLMFAINHMRALPIAVLLVLSVSMSAEAAAKPEQIPLIGSEGPTEDACVGVGAITTLDEHLAVRERPDRYARQKDKLAPATMVWICEKGADADGEEWQGIVYPSGEFQKMGDCKVSTPVSTPEPYKGPCRYGWVAAHNLRLVLG